jgi:predicted nucleic acid-binding protein
MTTLVDTGPLVALFDPKDGEHERCVAALKGIRGRLQTTVPVLTEAFHILDPGSQGSAALRAFVSKGGLALWHLDAPLLARAFELMDRYADHPMDLADASLIVAAESLKTQRIFTLDRRDFRAYRVRRGHRELAVEVLLQNRPQV